MHFDGLGLRECPPEKQIVSNKQMKLHMSSEKSSVLKVHGVPGGAPAVQGRELAAGGVPSGFESERVTGEFCMYATRRAVAAIPAVIPSSGLPETNV